jgi:hypothetical protein
MSERMKTCLDCLHCKVSVTSTKKVRFCFCAVKKVREDYIDTFWLIRPLCNKFDELTINVCKRPLVVVPTGTNNRRPLLRNRLYV